jgi:hypothetical protein
MKNKIITIGIVFCAVLCFDYMVGYVSTEIREEIEHSGRYNEAYRTEREEEVEHSGLIDDAYLTERAEEKEHSGLVNDAYATEAAEKAARSY